MTSPVVAVGAIILLVAWLKRLVELLVYVVRVAAKLFIDGWFDVCMSGDAPTLMLVN